jgi:exodeoxyribonuclease VII large subunit
MNLFTDKRILSVSQLTRLITDVLEENFEHVWVEGEISNIATPASGHLYFTLKDAGAQIRCVLFRAAARSLKFKPTDGMRLIVRGRVSVFAQRGDYQLLAEYMEPQGIGALQLAFIQLKERLAREGIFDESLKKPIPLLPTRVGIVTSPTGAAIHDILTVINRRYANIEILIAPVKVQGDGAAGEIAAAVRDFNRYREVDVLIVGRGGGSLEDLWAFNEEIVARAISASRIPVISAVGHEIDFTIADLVADLRAPTPSAAAELVVASKAELSSSLESLASRLIRAIEAAIAALRSRQRTAQGALRDPAMLIGHLVQRLDYLQERLTASMDDALERRVDRLAFLESHLGVQSPAYLVNRLKDHLERLSHRQTRAIAVILENLRSAAARNASTLNALSPLATLSRGYAIAHSLTDGSLIRDSACLSVGQLIDLRLARGSAVCTVESATSGSEGLTDRGEQV